MGDDEINEKRKRLAGISGPGRLHPLLDLAQALADAYWRAGAGQPSARPYADETITVLTEAYGYLAAGDFLRGQTAGYLGIFHALRGTVHAGPAQDIVAGIDLIEEALTFPTLPPVTGAIGRMMLTQLYVTRVAGEIHSPGRAAALAQGGAAALIGDVDRATASARQLLDSGFGNADATAFARTMLTLIDALRRVLNALGADGRAIDRAAVAAALTDLRTLAMKAGGDLRMPGLPPLPPIVDGPPASRVESSYPLVTLVIGPEPLDSFEPPPRPAPTTDVPALRTALHEMLAGLTDGGDPYASVRLLPASDRVPVDDLLALAASVVGSQDEPTGLDHLLLAVALYLRGRRDDSGGWAGGIDGGDIRASGDRLVAAAAAVGGDGALLPAVLEFGRLLADGTLDRLAEPLADLTRALRTLDKDALVIRLPDGMMTLDAATGRLERRDTLNGARAVFVLGDDVLPDGDLVVSYVGSPAQIVGPAGLARRPVTDKPVFVVNPRGDREPDTIDAMLLRRTFYPRSIGLGQTVENADGPATPDAVRAHLDASILCLGCGLSADGIELDGSSAIDPATLTAAGGGLVILPPGRYLPWADALLTAGFSGVIGWLAPVPVAVASLMLFVLHAKLVDERLPPASAVAETRRWLRAPDLDDLPHLPASLARAIELVTEDHRTALVHRGI